MEKIFTLCQRKPPHRLFPTNDPGGPSFNRHLAISPIGRQQVGYSVMTNPPPTTAIVKGIAFVCIVHGARLPSIGHRPALATASRLPAQAPCLGSYGVDKRALGFDGPENQMLVDRLPTTGARPARTAVFSAEGIAVQDDALRDKDLFWGRAFITGFTTRSLAVNEPPKNCVAP